MAARLLRCPCGYEASEAPRPGHELVAVYHLHYDAPGWGAHPTRMEAIRDTPSTHAKAAREVVAVS